MNKNSNFDKELIQKTIDISAGDLFLFYTDGITEARNGLKTEFGEERLTKIVAEDAHLSADEFKDKLVANLNLFVKKALLDDDATFVVIKT
ncbi:SpoIIE family protein phosphatase [candidate division KSB1 bacterium]|nr:SpoIIE family protein phosphatase [candidate division KSB1 bacterium]